MGKVSKLVQRKLLSYRSNIGSEAFRKTKYFGDIPSSYSVYRDLIIKSNFLKNILLLFLLIRNINPTAGKSSKNWFKITHESSQSGRSSLSYDILNFTKMSKRCCQSAVMAYFPGQISQQRFIQGHFGLVLWALSTRYAYCQKLFQEFSSSVKCLCLRQPYWCTNKSKTFSKCPRP